MYSVSETILFRKAALIVESQLIVFYEAGSLIFQVGIGLEFHISDLLRIAEKPVIRRCVRCDLGI